MLSGRKIKKNFWKPYKVAEQRSLLTAQSRKGSPDSHAHSEDWSCLTHLQSPSIPGDLVFSGCLLCVALFVTILLPSRWVIWTSEWSLLAAGDSLPSPGWYCLERATWRLCFVLGEKASAWPGSSTMFLLLPFDSLIVNLLGISLTVLFTLLLVFIIVPAIFGVSFGIRKLYMKTLLKIFAVSCGVYKWLLHRGGEELIFSGWLLPLYRIWGKLGEWQVAFWVKRKLIVYLWKPSAVFWAEVLVCLIHLSEGTYSMALCLPALFRERDLKENDNHQIPLSVY